MIDKVADFFISPMHRFHLAVLNIPPESRLIYVSESQLGSLFPLNIFIKVAPSSDFEMAAFFSLYVAL